ncbi:MAG: TIGR02302 family protein [Pseudomonadota bacterium]
MADFLSRPRGLSAKLRRVVGWTRAGLWVEALMAGLWPLFTVTCLVLSFALFGGFEAMGPIAHRFALAVAMLLMIGAFVWGVWGLRAPSRSDAVDRLDGADRMRPLATLSDRLPEGEQGSTARALWNEHQRRAEQAAERFRAARPDLRLSGRDQWALRLFAVALLGGATVGSGREAVDRLTAAALPGTVVPVVDGIAAAVPAVEAWAVPPAYTQQETVLLSRLEPGTGTVEAPLTLPQGTEITIRATGMSQAPALLAAGLEPAPAFVSLGGGLYETTAVLARSGALRVGEPDAPLAAWQITMTPDAPPEIEVTDPPRAAMSRALEVAFAARDDHGVVAAWVEIELATEVEERMEVEPIEFALPLPISGDPREVADVAVRDLTDHPWAGAEVLVRLIAEDAAGQRGETDPIAMRLPERRFTDPLARALAEQRRELVIDYGQAERVLDTVQAVSRRPDEVFDDHVAAYLATRLAMRRLGPALVEDSLGDTAPDVAELLWQAALGLESGDMASALERLREAEERLRTALESGTDEEIAAAIDELREAINEYLQEMVRQALQNPDAMDQIPEMSPSSRELSQQDLEDMLDQLQRQAESGLRDQAREMLSQLSQMLQNLQAAQGQQGQSAGEQALQQLQDMIQRQQQLSDETFDELRQQRRQGQQGQQGQRGQQGQGQQGQGQQPGQGQQQGQAGEGGARGGTHSENGRLAAEQEALRRAIDELRDQLGGGEGMDGASRALEQAERSMGEARDDLQGNATGDALQDQMDALDSLQQGAEALAEAVQNGQGQTAANGRRDGTGRAQDQQGMDPFDRPAGTYGAIDGSSTEVPGRALVDRARELLEELRRRSADQARPEIELRYLERLLEQF